MLIDPPAAPTALTRPLAAVAVSGAVWRNVRRLPRPGRATAGPVSWLSNTAYALESTAQFLTGAQHHQRLWASHQPGVVRAPVTYLRATQRPLVEHLSVGTGRGRDWRPFVGPVTMHDVIGDHHTVLTDPTTAMLLTTEFEHPVDGAESNTAEVLTAVRRFLDLFRSGRTGSEVIDAFFPPGDDQCLVFDSYDSDFRGFQAIRQAYATEFQAITHPTVELYNPFVRIGPNELSACVAGLIDANVTLRSTKRQISFLRVRVTWVLERHRQQWRVVHIHYSLPVGVPLHQMT